MNALEKKSGYKKDDAFIIKPYKIKNKIKKPDVSKDFLTIFTSYTRIFGHLISDYWEILKKSKTFSVIVRSTQPMHFIMIALVGTISCAFFQSPCEEEKWKSPFIHMIYFGSVSAHFGTQLWMTFISGLSLYFNLPRCTFRKVQQILFPMYFMINSILSFVSLFIFLLISNLRFTVPSILIQVGVLTSCFLIEVIVTFYFTPPLLHLMTQISALEELAGVGMEIGEYNAGVLSLNEEYVNLYRRFRGIHIYIAMCNVITVLCSTIHINYLSKKIMLI